MGIQIILPGHGYPNLRRWARYKVDLHVAVTLRDKMPAILNGRGSELNCGGMTVFLQADLCIGELTTVEFTPPFASKPVIKECVVRNRRRYSYGLEFLAHKGAA